MTATTQSKKIKRGLVIGCGGVAGGAWVIPTLARLEKELNWDATQADAYIGTSVGAMLVSLLSAGTSVERMMQSQAQSPELKNCIWNHDKDYGGSMPPRPKFKLTAPKLLFKWFKGEVPLLTALAGLAPQGTANMQPFMDMLNTVIPSGGWVDHPSTWLMVIDHETGERVALGADMNTPIPQNKAACASYGVPGWCPPVTLNGRTYLDGGVASPSSADYMLKADVDEVIVLAPMASTYPDQPKSLLEKIERNGRRKMTKILDAEIALLEKAGKKVIRMEPGPEDLKAFGFNMMDPKRRKLVYETALSTAENTVLNAINS